MDEKAGRRVAIGRNIVVVGTLGVLEKADAEGLIRDLPGLLDRLEETSFRLSKRLKEAVLQRHRGRRKA